MNYTQMANGALEDMVAANHPGYENGAWLPIVPTKDPPAGWGSVAAAWRTDALQAIAGFIGRIGFEIDVPAAAIKKAGGERLIEFRNYLALKAQKSAAEVRLKLATEALKAWDDA
jgi:hypothetical protein